MEHQQTGHQHSGHQHSALIQTLLDCARACEECTAVCLHEKDVAAMTRCIEIGRDCTDLCFLGAKLLIRDSEVGHRYLAVCEEVCRLCAEECSRHDDEHCRRCAEASKTCAEACHAHHGQVQVN